MFSAMVNFRNVFKGVKLAINSHPQVTRTTDLVKNIFERILPFSLDGRHQVDLRALLHRFNLGNNFIGSLGADRDVAFGAMGFTQPAKKNTKVVMNFSDGPDGGTGTLAAVFLFDSNCRR